MISLKQQDTVELNEGTTFRPSQGIKFQLNWVRKLFNLEIYLLSYLAQAKGQPLTIQSIAKSINLSYNTVYIYLNKLENRGFISKKKLRPKLYIYSVENLQEGPYLTILWELVDIKETLCFKMLGALSYNFKMAGKFCELTQKQIDEKLNICRRTQYETNLRLVKKKLLKIWKRKSPNSKWAHNVYNFIIETVKLSKNLLSIISNMAVKVFNKDQKKWKEKNLTKPLPF